MKRQNKHQSFFGKSRMPALAALAAAVLTAIVVFGGSCKKYLHIPLPANSISGSDAYASDQTTSGVLNKIYYDLETEGHLLGVSGLGYNAGLYTDELQTVSSSNAVAKQYYGNQIIGDNGGVLWATTYQDMEIANTTIEAMRGSSLPGRDQWLGEALFLRALMYYYLVNTYGDVPMPLTPDYKINELLSRIPQANVYPQIVADLKEAQTLLDTSYVDYNGNVTTTDRARPNKASATALLARVYLYMGDWADAETQAGMVIGNNHYAIESPAGVFLLTSRETIWGMLPTQGLSFEVRDARAYIITAGSTPTASGIGVTLSPQLLAAFEPDDLRYTSWVGVSAAGMPAVNYYFANKYKTKSPNAPVEAFSVLRLSEQYLIRAEARAQQNNLDGAIDDIDVIRTRAGLAGTTATSQAGLLAAILQERRIEFFAELGHRFFDLKRTGNIDAVMAVVSPQKGTHWAAYMQYWPILTSETIENPNLKQTPGYQQ